MNLNPFVSQITCFLLNTSLPWPTEVTEGRSSLSVCSSVSLYSAASSLNCLSIWKPGLPAAVHIVPDMPWDEDTSKNMYDTQHTRDLYHHVCKNSCKLVREINSLKEKLGKSLKKKQFIAKGIQLANECMQGCSASLLLKECATQGGALSCQTGKHF